MKRKYLIIGILTMLVGCGSDQTSNIENGSFESVSSSEYSESLESESFVSEDNSLTGIEICLVDEKVYAGNFINYEVKFEPITVTNKDFILSTSTPDILSIDGLEVKALYMGVGKLKATSTDGNFSSEIDVEVLKPNPYNEVIELLRTAKNSEMQSASESYFSYSYMSELYSSNTSYRNYIFNDGIKSVDELSEKEEYKYILDNSLKDFVIDSKNNNLDETATPIGEASNAISLEEANERVSLSCYNDVYGFTTLTESMLLDINSFYMDKMVIDVEVTELNNEYHIEGSCGYFASSFDEKESKLEINAVIKFDDLNRLESVKIYINKYLFKDNKVENEASIRENYEYGLFYEKRVNMPLSSDDYYVSSFEIDTSNFANDEGINVLEIEEKKSINIINEFPSLHFDEKYILEIEDDSIVGKGLTDLEIIGIKAGTTNINVVSSKGVERSFSLTVIEPLVKSISLGYIPNFIMVGESFEINATCYPSSASDRSYTVSLAEGDEDKASITLGEGGKYMFTALSDGQVTIVATSNSNPSIKDETRIIIQKKPSVDDVKEKLCQKVYTATDCELKFSNDGTGDLSLQGGGIYTFSWDLRVDGTYVFIDFSNITVVKNPDRWYDFKGVRGSYTNNEASFISLIVYDLDYEENWPIQFSAKEV